MRKLRLPLAIILSLFSVAEFSFAAEGTKKVLCDTKKPQEAGEICVPDQSPVRGLHGGVAVVYSPDNGGIGAVTKDTGTGNVRVTKENKAAARAAFELHYFLPGLGDGIGWGPFVSLNTRPVDGLDKGQLFSSVGIGFMVGALADEEGTGSINLGVGVLVDTDVQKLASGVTEGQPSSLNENQLLKSTTETELMAILSYNFAF